MALRSDTPHSALIGWLQDVYTFWKAERLRRYEENWNYSYDAIRGDYNSEWVERWKKLEGHAWRSRVFFKLSKVKTMASVSQVIDMLERLPYTMKSTSRPEFSPGQFIPTEIAEQRAKAMNRQIDDRLEEAKLEQRLGTCILEGAMYGGAFLKAPVLRNVMQKAYQLQVPQPAGYQGPSIQFPPEIALQYGRHVPVQVQRLLTTIEHPSIWQLFWDFEARTLEDGIGVLQRTMMNTGMLKRLGYVEGYDRVQVEAVLSEQANSTGSGKFGQGSNQQINDGPAMQRLSKSDRNIEVLEWWGRVPLRLLQDREAIQPADVLDGDEVEIFCVFVGDRMIRPPVPNPLEGRRPYHVFPWEDLPHEILGMGVPESIRDSQVMLNGLCRAAMDSKAFSTCPQKGVLGDQLLPGQDPSTDAPGKVWQFKPGVTDIRQAIQWFAPPDTTGNILDFINMFERWADQESGLPNIMHGETARFDPKTAFAFSKLLEAGARQLGKVIRNIDSGLIEPIVTAFFDHEMATNPDESIKGDYQVIATGFASYRERLKQGESIQMALQLALSNAQLLMLTNVPNLYRDLYDKAGMDSDRYVREDAEVIDIQNQVQAGVQAALAGLQPPPGRVAAQGDVNAQTA